ncbi:hypothetical protein [Rhodoplanes roseus]|uniref:Uncharacterized protein n=1 Tax=Rhodoplanes roseus TaxID=29409 RepID=A0A327L3B4_9BRAD|nr:hypothetical protein [Rhodoplanes roseus]RAI44674.1 hypothetical protein CH341_07970 [Rhodoplanes roseus]
MSRPVLPPRLLVVAGIVLGVAAAGPVAAQDRPAPNNLFTAAGFVVRYADTPEKLALLRSLPADKLTIRRKNGKTTYIYPDPNGCRCAFVGSPAAYAAYRNGGLPGVDQGGAGGGSEPRYVEEMESSIAADGSDTEPGSMLGGFFDQD